MKLKKAVRLLQAAYPGRSVSVQKDVRHHGFDADDAPLDVKFCACVLPGWNGGDCSVAYGKTLREAVQTALDNSQAAKLDTVSLASPLDRPHVESRDAMAERIIRQGRAKEQATADQPIDLNE